MTAEDGGQKTEDGKTKSVLGLPSSVYDALPGLEVPVGTVNKGLAELWRGTADDTPDDALAMQVNFLVYFGSATTPADAAAQFEATKQFSHRYPSRVVVLCPLPIGVEGGMRAKIFGECFLGKSKSDKRCIEFVLFSYPRSAREHIENEVFTCLCNDLPVYFWAHRFGESGRLAEYDALLGASRRILVDTAITPRDFSDFPWSRPEAMRDLVFARILPMRQGIGQFLSRYPMESLCRGLKSVVVSHGAAHPAEGRVLLDWVRGRLARCGGGPKLGDLGSLDQGDGAFRLESGKGVGADEFRMTFSYDDARSFSWKCDVTKGIAHFDADFGTGRSSLPAAGGLLPLDTALSEAMFF